MSRPFSPLFGLCYLLAYLAVMLVPPAFLIATPAEAQRLSQPASWIDHSGTITAGGMSQTLMAAYPNRRGFFVQNLSATDLYINDQGAAAATQPSIRVAAGTTFTAPATGVPVGAITIFGATTAQAFSSREW